MNCMWEPQNNFDSIYTIRAHFIQGFFPCRTSELCLKTNMNIDWNSHMIDPNKRVRESWFVIDYFVYDFSIIRC